MHAVSPGQGVERIGDRAALITQCDDQIAKQGRGADAVLVAHRRRVDAVPDGLLVGVGERGARTAGPRQPLESRQRLGVVGTVCGGDLGQHACGHNIIAASAVGTALALAEVADELGLTVVLLGTPAEELGGGKVLMLNAGTFDDIAATVMLHPGPVDIAAARSLALSEVTVDYTGRESHAAVAPYMLDP